tara:strand:- start:2157 stop:2801 length:645 start_codon:yes stop_codon:yes gene_type:complete
MEQFIEYDFLYLCESAKTNVPEPLWPDPDNEPLPEPICHQIVKRPQNRPERKEVTLFSIWTPLPEEPKVEGEEEAPVEGEEEADSKPKMTKDQTRWVIGPKESKQIYVKFFSKKVGSFPQTLKFEIVGSLRTFDLSLNSICEFPTINHGYRNVFMNNKKTRPPTLPESLLAKTFVVSENVFDFGPLLINKDPELRNGEDQAVKDKIKQVNSSTM